MFYRGQRVKHKRTGDTGTIQEFNQTYDPINRKTYYMLLIDGDDSREWFANGSQVEEVSQDGRHPTD